jgi:hypothetical protein
MTAAVRGWTKYIDNHYSRYMQGAQILLKNRGLNAFLVAGWPIAARTPPLASSFPTEGGRTTADSTQLQGSLCNGGHHNIQTQPAFFLFDEDLSKARLVGRDWQTCLRNLRSVPVAFEDGTEVLTAAEGVVERMVEDKGVMIVEVCGGSGGVAVAGGEGEAGMGMAMRMDIDP